MDEGRPSDALQPAAKKRAGGARDRDDPDDDDQPSYDPGTWTADAGTTRERRKVHVRRGAGGGGAAAPGQPTAANPFAGIALSVGAPPAAAPAHAAEAAPATAAAEKPKDDAAEQAETVVAEAEEPSAADKAAGAEATGDAEAGRTTADKVEEETKEAATETAVGAPAQDDKKGATASPSGVATPASSSIFGGSAGATSGFASLAAGGAAGSTFNFGGFGGGAAPGSAGGGLFGSATGGGIFGSSTTGGGLFGAATSGTGGGFGGFSFPKLDASGAGGLGKPLFSASAGADGEGGGDGGDERPDTFEPAEDPSIKPVVQLAVVQKVTGEEDEQTIYAESGKLFEYDSAAGKWRERGSGELRVNVAAGGTSSRMLMRQSGNLRLLLNARITESMRVQRMQGASGVTFGCVNTAALDPSQPPQSAAAADASTQDKADDKDGGSKPAAGAGLIRTWAFRTKGEEKILALLAALEKAKSEHSTAPQEEKKAETAEEAAV